jgi:hypothetical protein
MAQAIDSSLPPFKPSPASCEIHPPDEATTPSRLVAPDDAPTADRCVQDMDPSHASTVSHFADCNLECCYCALRWSARRGLLQGEEEI